ncbi:hypothetical protein [Acidiphilium sp.]|uniref:hypothetical protein n=1 Tax=Acidiphilium sp. TaxID=527 RepID=UPI0025867857|nr:hypothetical protein [Acidiphilium sp.]
MLTHAGGFEIAGIEIGIRLGSSLNRRIGERKHRLPAGAIGRMQVMPQTYAALRDRYGVPWRLAAGNAGPVRLQAFLRADRACASDRRHLRRTADGLMRPSVDTAACQGR